MTPTPRQITVSLDALLADSADWEDAAAALRGAARQVGAATVPVAAFSFAGHAVAAAYDGLRADTAGLLGGGAGNFVDIATALRLAAKTYEADEIANVHRLRNIY